MPSGVGARWTEEEYQAIRDHFPAHGTVWDGWAGLLNDRSPAAISRMASILGVRRQEGLRGCNWTAAEDQAVRDHFPTHGKAWDGWARVLPNRTWAGIDKRASMLGVCHDESIAMWSHAPWSAAEDAAIEALWPYHKGTWEGWKVILPNRGYSAICNRGPLVMERRRQADERDAVAELERYQAEWTTDQTRELLEGLAALAKATGHSPAEVLQKACELCHRAERRRESEQRGESRW